jgi:hypothetical protein
MIRFTWSENLFNQLRALIHDGELADKVKLILTGAVGVIRARQTGSPLLNAVKIVHLEVLSPASSQTLITRGGNIPDDTNTIIQIQGGGHPFITQYLLHHLWADGLEQATPAQVEQVAHQMRQTRAADLQGWWEAVGDSGQRAYALLAEADDWLTERALQTQVRDTKQPLDQGLAALCYHGLAERDESRQHYRVTCRLYRDWFWHNIIPPPSPPEPVEGPIKICPVFASFSPLPLMTLG